ncbi:MAG: TonB-dependent receptor [Phycisphaerae bacterium]|nr:TonB-dependent receptor [Phycisphaerae bacterium]
MKTIIPSILLTACFLGISGRSFAEAADTNEQPDFFEMSLEELMEVPVVVSASRQEQKITEASVPISIITAEDIHYSGLTSIPEILQFTPGVDFYKANRYWGVIGIRGLHDMFSNRMQTLINGRLADNAIFGGPVFFTYPVMVEDIERIEIVRGPGGAAWGANAFNGVINIITKKPQDVLGGFTSTTINEFGDSYTHLRYAEKKDNWQWRVSANYEDIKTSEEALDGASYKSFIPAFNSLIGFDSYRARDFARPFRFDSEAIYDTQDDTKISFGTGYFSGVFGDFEFMSFYPQQNNRFEQIRPFMRIDHENNDESSSFLEWSGNFETMNFKNILITEIKENSLTGQYNFAPANGHHISIGTNLRWTHINTDADYDQQVVLEKEPFDEYWAGLFAVDRWEATDRLTLEAQLRCDWYSATEITDWSGRLSALYAIDEEKDHIFRLSAAKAYRSPLVALNELNAQTIPVGGGLYFFHVNKPDNLKSEEILSLEAGYTGKLAQGVTLRFDNYFQRYSDLLGYDKLTAGGLTYWTADNIDGANAWGSELELAFENKKGRLSVWYAYNDFQEDRDRQDIRACLPAKHKAGLTGRLFLADDWTLNANYKFTDTTPDNPYSWIDSSSIHRLDLTISKKIAKGRGELMFGVSDLLNKTIAPHSSATNTTAHEIPGRTFFVRLQLKF